MSKKSTWKRFDAPGGFQYNFRDASSLSDDDAAAAAADETRQIRACKSGTEGVQDWVLLVLQLPKSLQQVLLDQLDHGNLMTGNGQSGWPTNASIVANMRHRFGGEGQVFPAEVTWTVVNDPRQWREEVRTVEGQEFMLIA